ncbi:Fc receptor like A, transcript variant X6 [Ictidomys tridecemlineatus]|nr:Fc receptor like A, transcript variant X6 [Ictidomys tridecemlineatus]
MKLSCVPMAWALYIPSAVLWEAHLLVGPSSSAESPTLNPAPQKLAAPETTSKETPGPLPPLATPSEHRGFSSPDPHLHHQMSILLKLMQDVRALLGHLVIELRDLSGHLKPETTKAPVK